MPVVVTAAAEIDASNAVQLRAALVAADGSCPTVVVDMAQTVYCDSTGISTLVQARNQAETGGGGLGPETWTGTLDEPAVAAGEGMIGLTRRSRPAAEVKIDAHLVRRLLAGQFPRGPHRDTISA